MHHCHQKGKLPREEWLDPEYFDKYQKRDKEKKEKAEQSQTLIEQSHVQVALAESEFAMNDDESPMVFSG